MKEKINIIIEGTTNTGKSTLTYLIKEVLRVNGFIVNMEPDIDFINEEIFDDKMSNSLGDRVDGLVSKGRVITIKQKRLRR